MELVTDYIVQTADGARFIVPRNAWGSLQAHVVGTPSHRGVLYGDWLESLNADAREAHYKIIATPDSLFLMDRYALFFASSILEACGK